MLDRPAELIVIAGGDGTVRKVVTKLKHRETPLAILPLGTANNIARSLGIKGDDRKELVADWEQSRTARLDIGIAEDFDEPQPFIEAVGIGALAEATSDKIGGELDGEKRLLVGRDMLREQIDKAEPLDVEVQIDGRTLKGRWLLIEVMNNCYTGPALPLCPCAHSGDGMLDLVAVAEDQRDEMLAWLGAPEDSDPPVHTERGALVRLKWTGKPTFRVDDKRMDAPKGEGVIDVRLQEKPLTVLLPPEAAFARPAGGDTGRRPLEDA
jgi:diacylglycerol kinase (ATP)